LQQLSIITGMLYVEFDFYPNTPVKFHKKDPTRGPTEIPTTTSNLGTVVRAATATLEQISQIKFDVLVGKVNKILDQINAGIERIDFKGINQGVIDVTDSAQNLLKNDDVRQAASNLNAALKEFEKLSSTLSAQVDPVSTELHKTSAETRKTLERINQAAENLRLATQPGTGLRAELDETLRQIADAAQAIRTLSNYLERNPNAILTGKAEPREDEKK
jgi:paraquat-inducible protein B